MCGDRKGRIVARSGRRRSVAVRLYLLSHGACQAGRLGWPFAKLLHWTAKILTAADIDPRAHLHPTVYIPHATGVVIGETATVGADTVIMPGVVIGAQKLTSGKRHADVGARVMVGAGAKVLGPVVVGDDAIIGANAVVIDDVPPGATAVGVPARIVVGAGEDSDR